jgi:transcription elongation factor Elf1
LRPLKGVDGDSTLSDILSKMPPILWRSTVPKKINCPKCNEKLITFTHAKMTMHHESQIKMVPGEKNAILVCAKCGADVPVPADLLNQY